MEILIDKKQVRTLAFSCTCNNISLDGKRTFFNCRTKFTTSLFYLSSATQIYETKPLQLKKYQENLND